MGGEMKLVLSVVLAWMNSILNTHARSRPTGVRYTTEYMVANGRVDHYFYSYSLYSCVACGILFEAVFSATIGSAAGWSTGKEAAGSPTRRPDHRRQQRIVSTLLTLSTFTLQNRHCWSERILLFFLKHGQMCHKFCMQRAPFGNRGIPSQYHGNYHNVAPSPRPATPSVAIAYLSESLLKSGSIRAHLRLN